MFGSICLDIERKILLLIVLDLVPYLLLNRIGRNREIELKRQPDDGIYLSMDNARTNASREDDVIVGDAFVNIF